MSDSGTVNMYLNIGDQRISLTVPFDRQNFVRDVEHKINQLYKRWRKDFTSKTDKEIMAMVAYQFASHYSELKDRYELAQAQAMESLRFLQQSGEDR